MYCSLIGGPPLPSGTCLANLKAAIDPAPVIPISTIDPFKPGFSVKSGQVTVSGGDGTLVTPGRQWIPK